ncbi:hypothetical protein EYF80_064575 [Liparis tanakae]|uniref:Uncharacterized protein n=1 Tax=Liparis tanakae TaxID=230148 RepID=A0A4Z2E911_9TELE|nr:hypothetical protein EYF80_064575 [Liparis tanakae]
MPLATQNPEPKDSGAESRLFRKYDRRAAPSSLTDLAALPGEALRAVAAVAVAFLQAAAPVEAGAATSPNATIVRTTCVTPTLHLSPGKTRVTAGRGAEGQRVPEQQVTQTGFTLLGVCV